MKIIVAGSRTFNNYLLLKEILDNLDITITEIVCGEARGADLLGKKYAYEKLSLVNHFTLTGSCTDEEQALLEIMKWEIMQII